MAAKSPGNYQRPKVYSKKPNLGAFYLHLLEFFFFTISILELLLYTVNIYMYKTIEARVNTVEIPTTGKSCSLYWELLHPILGIPLASIGKSPFIGKLPIEI